MSLDIAINFRTGDLEFAPSGDLEVRTGIATVQQRIRVRLRIHQGDWAYDFTGKTLGSRLFTALRHPQWRVLQEVPLMVREALAPMEDIVVRDVVVEETGPTHVGMVIYFSLVEPDGTVSTITQQTQAQLLFTG